MATIKGWQGFLWRVVAYGALIGCIIVPEETKLEANDDAACSLEIFIGLLCLEIRINEPADGSIFALTFSWSKAAVNFFPGSTLDVITLIGSNSISSHW